MGGGGRGRAPDRSDGSDQRGDGAARPAVRPAPSPVRSSRRRTGSRSAEGSARRRPRRWPASCSRPCCSTSGVHEDRDSVFALAAEIEGHPDNAAPAVFGGFTIALPDGSVRRFDPHPELRPVLLVPPAPVATADARSALPASVARDDAVFNVAHAALAVEALTRDPSLLAAALQDRLHQRAAARDGRRGRAGDRGRRRGARPPPVAVVPVGCGSHDPRVRTEGGRRSPRMRSSIRGEWRILRPGVRATGFEVLVEP